MNPSQKEKEITERYLDLPEDVQKALFATTTSDMIFEVGKKHGLVIDKMGELADETGLVMLGMTKPSEYIKNLEKRLGVEAIKAKEIAEDINQKVFSSIRESLKKIHGITAPTAVGAPKKISQDLLPNNLPVEPAQKEKIPQKIVMPPQPENIKVGEIAKEVEPKVEIKPSLSGRIDSGKFKMSAPLRQNFETSPQRVEKETMPQKTEIPDIFVRKIPIEKPKIEPDFVPPPKEPAPRGPTEAKNMLEKELIGPASPSETQPQKKNFQDTTSLKNDQYREPLQ